MAAINASEVVKRAEAEIAVAKLAEALTPAELVDIRRPSNDAITSRREVVFTFENEATARKFFAAAQHVAGKL